MKTLRNSCFFSSIFICLALSALLFWLFFGNSIQREPKINLTKLFAQQEKALPDLWITEDSRDWQIYTDSDFTWARYAVYMNYDYRVDKIRQEIHVFADLFRAKIVNNPSSSGVFLGKYYIPEDWVFKPDYADYYEMGCTHNEKYVEYTRTCKIILRYQEFAFVITTPIRDYMSLENLEDFLSATDQFMHNYLSNSSVVSLKKITLPSIDELR